MTDRIQVRCDKAFKAASEIVAKKQKHANASQYIRSIIRDTPGFDTEYKRQLRILEKSK